MKRFICTALSLVLVLAAAFPAFGESGGQDLEKAIRIVKNAAAIPADFSEFNYSTYEENGAEGKKVTVWNLEWSREDGSGGISASVDSQGNLNSYYKYVDREESGLAKVEREAGRKQADAFLKGAMPSLAGQMRAVREKENASSTGDLCYTYQLYVNDVPVSFILAEVYVDKYSGGVRQFSGLSAGQSVPEFPAAKPAFPAEEAVQRYAETAGAELNYYTYYDSREKKLTVFLGYNMDQSSGKALNAETGEMVSVYNDYHWRYGSTANAKDMGAGGASEEAALTPEEQSAVENVAGLISREKAESLLRAAAGLKSGAKLQSTYLGKEYTQPDEYRYRLSFDGAYGVVDAKTGEVLSFSIYDSGDKKGSATLNEEQAGAKAEAFAKKMAPEKFAQTVLKESAPDVSVYKNSGPEEKEAYTFFFRRSENGIGVAGSGLTVTVDARDGAVTSYDNAWPKVSFPDASGAITSAAAFETFNEKGNLQLTYVKTAADQVSLVYTFENSVTSYLIDPFKGTQIDRRGKAYQDGLMPEYGDIAGHWAESTIRALLNNGYYLSGDRFLPETAITQEDFLRYLYAPGWAGADQDELYQMLERRKIVLTGEKAPERAVTRQEAAKFMVRYLGFDKLAQKNSIFKDLFADKVEDSYRGYAAVCYGLGVMTGDEKGRFNGGAQMTRAEAASALYQLLNVE